jgi:hypothetical protein
MNLSVLIHTFNGYQHLWPGCVDAWKPIIKTEASTFYFGTDIVSPPVIEYSVPDYFEMLYSGPGEWSDRLRQLLLEIPTDYVFYCQEDHYPTGLPPIFSDLMDIMTEKDLLRLQISPIVPFYKLFSEENTLFFDVKSKYLVSHQPSIWKKSFLLDCLKPGETPWVNEYKGTQRLQQNSQIRDFIHKKIAIYPYEWYKHMCIKGKMVES